MIWNWTSKTVQKRNGCYFQKLEIVMQNFAAYWISWEKGPESVLTHLRLHSYLSNMPSWSVGSHCTDSHPWLPLQVEASSEIMWMNMWTEVTSLPPHRRTKCPLFASVVNNTRLDNVVPPAGWTSPNVCITIWMETQINVPFLFADSIKICFKNCDMFSIKTQPLCEGSGM